MKKFFLLFLFYACTGPAPTGPVNFASSLATTLKSGFVTVPGTTYDARSWQITSTVTLTSGVKWIGGTFSGTGAAFTSRGNCIGAQIQSVTLAPSIDELLDASMKPFLTYNGNDTTFLYKNLLVDTVTISGKTMLYNGPWEAVKTFHNVSFGVSIKNVTRTYDSNSLNTLVFGASTYKFRGENWILKGDTYKTNGDNGVIYINGGNAQALNFYRMGKQDGYIMRCVGAKLGSDPDQDVKVINCVDEGTVLYGTLDFRIEPGWIQTNGTIPISGCNGYFINNNSANKTDKNNGYVTNAVIMGQLVDDQGKTFTISIMKNIALNAWVSGASNNSSLVKNNSNGKALIDSGGNIDVPPGKPVPAGLVDAAYYSLIDGVGAHPTFTVKPGPRSVAWLYILNGSAYITYDDSSKTILPLKSSIIVK